MPDFKCNWIENMISIETDGFTRPCCLETSVNAAIAPISKGIISAFNDQKLLQLREDLKEGFSKKTKDFCYRCQHLEMRNQSSMRTSTPELCSNRELKLIQFKMSNKCQLTCVHCGPDRSSGWRKLLNISPHVIDAFEVTEEFLKELSDILPQLEVIKFTGGEPFLDPNHWKILEFLQDYDTRHISLHYITNGVSPFRKELWKGWKEINCSVSIDGHEKSYEWFRRGASWKEIVSGVNHLNQHSTISINYAITPYTIQDYLKSKDFWKYKFLEYNVVYPAHASLFNFPQEIVSKINDFEKIPGSDSAVGSNLKYYQDWARQWDKRWDTVGWADELFWWMNHGTI